MRLLFKPIFSWSSSELGALDTYELGASPLVETLEEDVRKKGSDDFVRWLVSKTTSLADDRPEGEDALSPRERLSSAQVERLSQEELNRFVALYLRHSDTAGEPVEAGAPTNPALHTSAASDVLRNRLIGQAAQFDKQMSDLVSKIRSSIPDMSKIFPADTLAAISRSNDAAARLSQSLSNIDPFRESAFSSINENMRRINDALRQSHGGVSFKQLKTVEPAGFDLTPLPNPQHEANAHLERLAVLADELKPVVTGTAEVIVNMNSTVYKVLANFKDSSDNAKRFAYWAIGVAIASVVISSALQLYLESRRDYDAVVAAIDLDREEVVASRKAIEAQTKALEALAIRIEQQAAATQALAERKAGGSPAPPKKPPVGSKSTRDSPP